MTPQEAMRKVTDDFVQEGMTPYKINDGNCDEWANEVFELLACTPHKVEMWETPFGYADTTHVFLRIDGLFHDAECHAGVTDHNDLPIFARLVQAGCTRQAVWLLDYNEASKPYRGENRRDMTEQQVRDYYAGEGMEVPPGVLEPRQNA